MYVFVSLYILAVCFLCSLQTPPDVSLSLMYNSSEASHDDAEFSVMGGNLLISPLSELVSVMFAAARGMKRQACKAGRKVSSKTDPNAQTKNTN